MPSASASVKWVWAAAVNRTANRSATEQMDRADFVMFMDSLGVPLNRGWGLDRTNDQHQRWEPAATDERIGIEPNGWPSSAPRKGSASWRQFFGSANQGAKS